MLISTANRIRTFEWAPWKPLLSENVFVGTQFVFIAIHQWYVCTSAGLYDYILWSSAWTMWK